MSKYMCSYELTSLVIPSYNFDQIEIVKLKADASSWLSCCMKGRFMNSQILERISPNEQQVAINDLAQRWNRLAGFTGTTGLVTPSGSPIVPPNSVQQHTWGTPGLQGQNVQDQTSFNRQRKNYQKTVAKLKRVSFELDYLMSYMIQNRIPMPNLSACGHTGQ